MSKHLDRITAHISAPNVYEKPSIEELAACRDEIRELRRRLGNLVLKYEEIVSDDTIGRSLTDYDLMQAKKALHSS